MSQITRILERVELGERDSTEQLLPLVYDELRKLAAVRMSRESVSHTLGATALVHEAYLRLFRESQESGWASRGHFFSAAAESMRRILIEHARRKKSLRAGGNRVRLTLANEQIGVSDSTDDLLCLDDALEKLETVRPEAAQIVKLRVFAGLSLTDSARSLEMPERSARRLWTYARAWLRREMQGYLDKRN